VNVHAIASDIFANQPRRRENGSGLKALIERKAARRLAERGGSDPAAGPRRRSAPPPE